MKFLLCLALCFAAAQAGVIGVPSAVAYSAPYTAYSAGVAPAFYNAPLTYSAYSGYPSVYSAGLAAPAVYSASGLGLGNHVVSAPFSAAPAVYSSPSVYSTLLKK